MKTDNERGSLHTELAITIPVLMMILGATIDLSLAFFTGHLLETAAHQGARIAVVTPDLDPAIANNEDTIRNIVATRLVRTASALNADIDVEGPQIFADEPTNYEMIRVTLTATHNFFFFRLLGIPSVQLARQSSMRYEWQPDFRMSPLAGSDDSNRDGNIDINKDSHGSPANAH